MRRLLSALLPAFICAFALYLLAMPVLPPQPALAAPFRVCPSGCTYTTIQAAVRDSFDGAVINVAAGTYNENVRITRTGPSASWVTLMSRPAMKRLLIFRLYRVR